MAKNFISATNMSTQDSDQAGTQRQQPAQVWIVGKNHFQNRLMESYLKERIDPPCDVAITHQWLHNSEMSIAQRRLALLDCFGIDTCEVWHKLVMIGSPDPWVEAVALFNVDAGAGQEFERQAIQKKVRGVFYADDPPDLLPKAIGKIVNGEFWFSRQTISQLLMESKHHPFEAEAVEATLTHREKEILIAIASGSSNAEISESFAVSPHTVKTHLYNIYRKIEVRNRLEATLWVTRYL